MAELETSQVWTDVVERFFKKELNIGVYYFHFRYELFPDHIATFLFPFEDSRNTLSYEDIEKIREFFVKVLGMNEGGDGFEKGLENVRKRGAKNGLLTLKFEYVSPVLYIPTFVIEIPIIYAEIGDDEYFFLSQVVIENREDDKEANNVLINKAVRVLNGRDMKWGTW
jgi:hypothetical protein